MIYTITSQADRQIDRYSPSAKVYPPTNKIVVVVVIEDGHFDAGAIITNTTTIIINTIDHVVGMIAEGGEVWRLTSYIRTCIKPPPLPREIGGGTRGQSKLEQTYRNQTSPQQIS